MVRVGEKIKRLEFFHRVTVRREVLDVAGESDRITGHVNDLLGRQSAERIDDLINKIIASVNTQRSTPRPIEIAAAFSIEPEVVVTPRDAFFSKYEVISATDSVGRVCAEMVCPYPPGVPVLSPGERITQQALDALFTARDYGHTIKFVADPTLQTLKVLPN